MYSDKKILPHMTIFSNRFWVTNQGKLLKDIFYHVLFLDKSLPWPIDIHRKILSFYCNITMSLIWFIDWYMVPLFFSTCKLFPNSIQGKFVFWICFKYYLKVSMDSDDKLIILVNILFITQFGFTFLTVDSRFQKYDGHHRDLRRCHQFIFHFSMVRQSQ